MPKVVGYFFVSLFFHATLVVVFILAGPRSADFSDSTIVELLKFVEEKTSSPAATSPLSHSVSNNNLPAKNEDNFADSPQNASFDLGAPSIHSPLASYFSLIKNQISARQYYPKKAREMNVEGTVKLQLRVSKDGKISDVLVFESSGSETLDAAAVKVVTEAGPFPEIPDTRLKAIQLLLPMVYKIID